MGKFEMVILAMMLGCGALGLFIGREWRNPGVVCFEERLSERKTMWTCHEADWKHIAALQPSAL